MTQYINIYYSIIIKVEAQTYRVIDLFDTYNSIVSRTNNNNNSNDKIPS